MDATMNGGGRMAIGLAEFTKSYDELGILAFEKKLEEAGPQFGRSNQSLSTMQLNICHACNFACGHCFLESSPERKEMMSKETMSNCLSVFRDNGFRKLDITGGAPEMNPDLEWLIDEGAKLGAVMVRTNAALLTEPQYRHLIDAFKRNKAEVIVSLPCYTKDNVDEQRGEGNFEKVIAGLAALNAVGYGKGGGLVLNLVYNPLGAYLPGSQPELEQDYKRALGQDHGIEFDSLFCLANTPLGRFRNKLDAQGVLGDYLTLIYESFNPQTLPSMMCRDQLNVDFDGGLYDCEMNHVLGLTIHGGPANIAGLLGQKLTQRDIRFNHGCYVCTAGSGSSCGGALV
jgi:radical SAM/Cys-rich protein